MERNGMCLVPETKTLKVLKNAFDGCRGFNYLGSTTSVNRGDASSGRFSSGWYLSINLCCEQET